MTKRPFSNLLVVKPPYWSLLADLLVLDCCKMPGSCTEKLGKTRQDLHEG